ncbi:Uncharacterized protein TCM_044773 [Theobroma cacao]|uniref:RRM domain-containing protein n=1 Tax=Theobroma cacao TaxID=3641 RepID=A0A061FSL1_THECC|nr:Uncharacterized protein TCM_044773 [Theobroma cacao]
MEKGKTHKEFRNGERHCSQLSWGHFDNDVNWRQLKSYFDEFGVVVDVFFLQLKRPFESKYAFMLYRETRELARAIYLGNGKMFYGMRFRVVEAKSPRSTKNTRLGDEDHGRKESYKKKKRVRSYKEILLTGRPKYDRNNREGEVGKSEIGNANDRDTVEKWRFNQVMIFVKVKSLRNIRTYIYLTDNGREHFVRATKVDIMQSESRLRSSKLVDGSLLGDMVEDWAEKEFLEKVMEELKGLSLKDDWKSFKRSVHVGLRFEIVTKQTRTTNGNFRFDEANSDYEDSDKELKEDMEKKNELGSLNAEGNPNSFERINSGVEENSKRPVEELDISKGSIKK